MIETVSILQGIIAVLLFITYALTTEIYNNINIKKGDRENLIEAYNENFALKDELRHLASNPNVEISRQIKDIIQ